MPQTADSRPNRPALTPRTTPNGGSRQFIRLPSVRRLHHFNANNDPVEMRHAPDRLDGVRAIGGERSRHKFAQRVGRDCDHLGLALGRPLTNHVGKRLEARHVSPRAFVVERIALLDLVKEREQKVHVRVGADKYAPAGGFVRFDAARINERQAPTTLHDGPKARHRIGRVDKAHARHSGIADDDHQTFGPIDVRKRESHARAGHPLADDELVVAVERTGVETLAGAQATYEARDHQRHQRNEATGVAQVEPDTIVAMSSPEASQIRQTVVFS